MTSRPTCPPGAHDALKADPAAFRAATIFQGHFDDGVERFEAGQCRACESQIWLPLERESAAVAA